MELRGEDCFSHGVAGGWSPWTRTESTVSIIARLPVGSKCAVEDRRSRQVAAFGCPAIPPFRGRLAGRAGHRMRLQVDSRESGFFVYIRDYGPLNAFNDKTWVPNDVELVQ